jgi:hypothetical protein
MVSVSDISFSIEDDPIVLGHVNIQIGIPKFKSTSLSFESCSIRIDPAKPGLGRGYLVHRHMIQ